MREDAYDVMRTSTADIEEEIASRYDEFNRRFDEADCSKSRNYVVQEIDQI